MTRCSICQRLYEGYGNNAVPVNAGRCCDRCDTMIVIPARIRLADCDAYERSIFGTGITTERS
jgi:hypothetical protein